MLKRVWHTSNTLFVFARHPHSGVNAQLRLRKPRAFINTPECGWGAETKRVAIGSVLHLFGTGAYTASDKALHQNSGLATQDYKLPLII